MRFRPITRLRDWLAWYVHHARPARGTSLHSAHLFLFDVGAYERGAYGPAWAPYLGAVTAEWRSSFYSSTLAIERNYKIALESPWRFAHPNLAEVVRSNEGCLFYYCLDGANRRSLQWVGLSPVRPFHIWERRLLLLMLCLLRDPGLMGRACLSSGKFVIRRILWPLLLAVTSGVVVGLVLFWLLG